MFRQISTSEKFTSAEQKSHINTSHALCDPNMGDGNHTLWC